MSKSVEYAGTVPSWGIIKEAARAAALELSIRMIDNLPAFPDEEPVDGWRELRFAAPTGMMTLRRNGNALELVVWGNADGEMRRDWERLTELLRKIAGEPSP